MGRYRSYTALTVRLRSMTIQGRPQLAWIVFALGGVVAALPLALFGMRLDLELMTWWYVLAVLFLGVAIMIGSMLYLDSTSETIREYFTQRTRVALATTAIGSIPLWMIAASHPEPMILGLVVGLLPLIAIKGVTSVRCPRCKGYLGVRTGFAIASLGMGGHTRIDYCESCQVSLDEPREGPRRDPVDD